MTLLFALAPCAAAATASAAETGPQWTVSSVSHPTVFAPSGDPSGDAYAVTVTNTGGAASNGEAITITDEPPSGLTPLAGVTAEDELGGKNSVPAANFSKSCGVTGSGSISCSYPGVVQPGDTLTLRFPMDVGGGSTPDCTVPVDAVSCVTNVVRVAGGGAPSASMATPTTLGTHPASFGLAAGGATTALSSTQAGAHPDLTVSAAFNTVNTRGATAGDLKNITAELPPGFAGDLIDTPACPTAQFLESECPPPTQIGVTTITLVGAAFNGPNLEPVYNLTPSPGQAARIGFGVGTEFFYAGDVAVRPGDYGLSTTFFNATAGPTTIDNVSLTIWGVPADPIHDPLRWTAPPKTPSQGHFGASSNGVRAPYFTSPTACQRGPLGATLTADSWQQPEAFVSESMTFGPLLGCDRLGMKPKLTAEATTNNTSAPSGFDLRMEIPQTYDNAEGLATSTLKQAVVTLPEGMTVNPSAGAGLGACTEAEYQAEPVGEPNQAEANPGCPSDSKLGTVEIVTPSLSEHVTGSVFLAEPAPRGEAGKNPFDSLLALYIVARIPNRGILVRAAGEVKPDPATGRLVTTFDTSNVDEPHAGLPPLPFSLFTFGFSQGNTAPLVTPPTCGQYTVVAELTPWANPGGSPLAPLIPPFPISGNCPSGATPPFNPQVSAGTENNQAGAYSPLSIRIARNDNEQELTGLSFQLPPGLTANLTGIPFCPEAQIAVSRTKTGAEEEANPSCPGASQIGTTYAGAGVGPQLVFAPGKLYLGGPYENAPFSVVSITSAKVGPFDLGTVVVHLPLEIDPRTATVKIPAGAADQIPHIIKGIVIHVREVRVEVNREKFMINPTSCNPFSFGATLIGSGANFASAADDVAVGIASPFRVTACQALPFKPSFTATTQGNGKANGNGASLDVKIAAKQGPQGKAGEEEANIAKVDVALPKALSSRLTTLQKACPEATYLANPATCPPASFVGSAVATTPILPVPLTGPAVFVSHGGEAFPDLVLLLQGYGVKIVLTGNTQIKNGVTFSHFQSVPDQPISGFELKLPEGKDAALAAIKDLCHPTKAVTVKTKVKRRVHGKTMTVTKKTVKQVAEPLIMPTTITAQNGAVEAQQTKLAVSECKKAIVRKIAKKKKGPRRGHKGSHRVKK